MVKKSDESRKPIIWDCFHRPRRETDAEGASPHSCGGFFVWEKFMDKRQIEIIELKKKVESAINNSMPDIQQLLQLNVNERTISCLIAKYLDDFSVVKISVDAEYDKHLDRNKVMSLKEYVENYRANRNKKEEFDCVCEYCKKIKSNEKFKDTESSKRPDVVIHKRNSDDKNYIVIEVKKNKKCLWDYLKLKYMTSPDGGYRYKLGIFIYFPQNKPEYAWFVDGFKKTL